MKLDSEGSVDDDPIIVVSMGDSYSSGEGIEDFYGQSDDHNISCENDDFLAHRSQKSWPGRLHVSGLDGSLSSHKDENWFFTAISGDTTSGMFDRKNRVTKEYTFVDGSNGHFPVVVDKKIGPQISVFDDLVEKGTVDYVTMTIGGNDVGFGNIIVSAVIFPNYIMCNDLEKKVNTVRSHMAEHANDLYDTYSKISAATKNNAELIIAGYPTLISEKNIPLLNTSVFALSEKEAVEINAGVREFNHVIEKAVSKSGDKCHFVSVEQEFAGHEAYSEEPFINPVILKPQKNDLNLYGLNSAYSIHPNEAGAAAYARCVQKKIDEIEKEKGTYVAPKQVTWIVKDALPISEIDELEQIGVYGTYAEGLLTEEVGYPTQWSTNTDHYQENYTADALSFRYGTNYGVIDYSGNILYPATLPASDTQYGDVSKHPVLRYERKGNPIHNYVRGPFFTVSGDVFHHDFADFDRDPGIGGTAPTTIHYVKDGVIYRKNAYGETYENEGSDQGREIIDIIDSSGSTIGGAVVKKDEILSKFDGIPVIFANGIVTYCQDGKYGFYSADDAKNITEPEYEDAKYFVEDCAPAKKDGKWGYVDKSGNPVTDFIFEDASTAYEGRVFVKVNGGYRILDLNTSLADLGYISADHLGELPQSEELPVIGKVTVNVSGLRIRTGPGTSFETTGKNALSGAEYDVYETTEAGGFTWYRIGDSRWIADDGTWLSFSAN